jgi:hypothetical protein
MLSAKVNRGVTQEYERHKSKNTTWPVYCGQTLFKNIKTFSHGKSEHENDKFFINQVI